MGTLSAVALVLVVAIAALALVTRRKAVDPLARAGSGASSAGPDDGTTVRMLWNLLRQSGDVLPEVAAELRAGRKIEAIKRLREASGLDLVDAKRVVEEMESQLANDGPLARLVDTLSPPQSGDPT